MLLRRTHDVPARANTFPSRFLRPLPRRCRLRGSARGRFDAELILLHVIEPPSYNSLLADLHTVAPEAFDRFLGAGLKHLRVTRLIERGEAARKIVECASNHQVDLIMMPTQGLGLYRRLILGSNTAKVLHDAQCPVWTGVHLEDAPPIEGLSCRRIACAVDLKPASARVLGWAERPRPGIPGRAHPDACRRRSIWMARGSGSGAGGSTQRGGRAGGAQKHNRLPRFHTGGGRRPSQSCAAARRGAADGILLVIGRRAETSFRGRLERTAYSIIRDSACPVVSV